jgi:anti-sigma B factor antagonist
VRGQIDLSTVPELKAAMHAAIESGGRHIIIDLAGVRYMDSSGFGALLGATKRLRPVGGQLYLVGCTEPIVRLLRITRLDTIFEVYESEESARRAITAVLLLEKSFGPAGPSNPLPPDAA